MTHAPACASASTRHSVFAITLLAIAAFVIVTTEFLIIGLLPALARDLDMSISAAGQLVTLFAFTVMLFGPPLTAALAHIERKRLFMVIMLIFAASNALAAVAPNIWVLSLARFIPALLLPVFWGTASETASQLVGPEWAGRAVAQVYLGIAAATLFGIPLGTVFANLIGWRGAFWGLTALSLLMLVLLALYMPPLARPERSSIGQQMRILRDGRFIGNIVLSVVVFTAMFTAYTYLADMLERLAGIAPVAVGWWLMGFGAIGLVGNWLGGHFVDRNPLGATVVFVLILAAGMSLSIPLAGSYVGLAVALTVWGIAYTALYPVCQVRVMKAASHAQALAGTLNVSAANAGIGLGAIIGGYSIEQAGLASIGYIAAAIALAAAVICLLLIPFKERRAIVAGLQRVGTRNR
ncbi:MULTISPECIES: MFS transporter [unclassified Pseudomonas]|uniref:MFS transporter n=1 Tax=unclassified Pseudomonas TaxID=196821 RepID=UPI0024494B37|nr:MULTISPECIES: MFS transporter [unclassified Pseudomonas]MDH0300964.1 MFS transporter [Pseudomonas sp. GD04091]MDH1983504.1 MFS transporter [Pseudomonas sp. GD03689]